MKVLYRYLYTEILALSLATTLVLTALLLAANVFREVSNLLLDREVSIFVIAKLVFLLIPFVLTFTLPWGLLMGILLVFGRMSRNNELTLIKSSGVGLAPIIAPVLVIAFAFSFLSFWINASIGPRSQEAFRKEGAQLLRANPLSLFSTGNIIDNFEGYRFYVGQHEGAELRDLHIWQLDEEGRVLQSVRADRAEIVPDLSHEQIVLHLFNARQTQRNAADPFDVNKIESGTRAAEFPMEIPLTPLFAKQRQERRSISFLTLGEVFGRVFDPLETLRTPNMTPLLTELQKRISFSLASFTFALIAIPLAIQVQRRETSVGFALSLGVVIAYYLIVSIAESLKARSHFFPEVIIWMPNLLFEIIGFLLIIRANRR